MIVPHLDADAEVFVLIARCDDSETVLTGPVEPMRRFQTACDEFEREEALLESSLSWTIDGVPVFGMSYAEKWIAMKVAETLSAEPTSQARRLKSLRRLAERVGNVGLVARLNQISAVIRSHSLGLPLSGSEQAALDWFALRERERLPDLPNLE
jgi:hypothetical protein